MDDALSLPWIVGFGQLSNTSGGIYYQKLACWSSGVLAPVDNLAPPVAASNENSDPVDDVQGASGWWVSQALVAALSKFDNIFYLPT